MKLVILNWYYTISYTSKAKKQFGLGPWHLPHSLAKAGLTNKVSKAAFSRRFCSRIPASRLPPSWLIDSQAEDPGALL